jgi:uncharacterized protein
MKRVFIIHGWDGYPQEGWFPWLKKELESRGYKVFVLAMPHPETPTIDEWVGFLKHSVGEPDEDTHFIGGSIGCQTILRYLETLEGRVVGSVVLVAPWMTLNQEVWDEGEETRATGKPWVEIPIDFEKVKGMARDFTCIFSDNDPIVPYEENRKIFEEKLHAKILTQAGKGHFRESDGVTELPIVLSALGG